MDRRGQARMNRSKVLRKKPAGAALALCACFAGLSCCTQAFSNSPSATPASLAAAAPVLDCATLAAIEISGVVGAKTHITSASPVVDGKPAPYCRITGYVEPMVKFEVRLPLAGWTQRFVQTGCGGLCGNLNIRLGNADGCYPADHGELALASSDMGHSGGMDGEFGEKDYQLRIDFAYRGMHVTTLAAKALIVAYYGRPAKYSYFAGCSDGGREALMEAERYPEDFNGITAGAPAMNFTTQNTFYHGWNALRNTSADGKPILTADKLPILHEAALRACDAADGLKDGLISDPLSCRVDPAVVECKPGQDEKTCLTQPQVQAARDIYAGAHDSQGNKLVLSGPLPGSELAWQGVYIPTAGNDHTTSPMISSGTLKYLAYEKNPPSDYRLEDLRFTPNSFTATTQLHALYDATDPDLSAFAKRGGKLILWHGWADPHISPLNTIAYYTAMNDVMGETEVQKFARLYLFPGGYHCGGGEGPFHFDLMSAVMAWVERGTAPFALVASHEPEGMRGPIAGAPSGMPGGVGQGSRNGPRSLAEKTTDADRTRPIYPYPLTAAYNGSGSVDDAINFSPGRVKPASPLALQWLGASFYRPHYELWCTGDGAAMACNPTP
jgi:Tannase and feruloyl esterase